MSRSNGSRQSGQESRKPRRRAQQHILVVGKGEGNGVPRSGDRRHETQIDQHKGSDPNGGPLLARLQHQPQAAALARRPLHVQKHASHAVQTHRNTL